MTEIIRYGLPLLSALLIITCALPWWLKHRMKRMDKEQRRLIAKPLKVLRSRHVALYCVLLFAIAGHIGFCAVILHEGSVLGILLLVILVLQGINGRTKRNERWLPIHRTLCVAALILLLLHAVTELLGL